MTGIEASDAESASEEMTDAQTEMETALTEMTDARTETATALTETTDAQTEKVIALTEMTDVLIEISAASRIVTEEDSTEREEAMTDVRDVSVSAVMRDVLTKAAGIHTAAAESALEEMTDVMIHKDAEEMTDAEAENRLRNLSSAKLTQ